MKTAAWRQPGETARPFFFPGKRCPFRGGRGGAKTGSGAKPKSTCPLAGAKSESCAKKGESSMKLKRLKVPQNAPMVMVSMRMPAEMVAALKHIAARRQMPYQAMIRTWLEEKLKAGV